MTDGDEQPLWPMSQPAAPTQRGPVVPEPARPVAEEPPPAPEADPGVPAPRAEARERGAAAGRPKRRRPRRNAILLTVVLALVATAATVGIVAFRTYDNATKIDRSTPTVVVAQLVDALFTARDDAAAARFLCKGQPDPVGELRALQSDLREQEKRFSTHFTVTVDDIQNVPAQPTRETVEVKLAVAAEMGRVLQPWTFDLVQQDGWRVCGAHKVPVPQPTP